MPDKPKLIRITTVPLSFRTLLKGQLKYMSENGFNVIAITSGKDLDDISQAEHIPVYSVDMTRKITPFKDLQSVWKLYSFFKKNKPHIVHTHTPKAGIVGMMAAWLAGVPIRLHTVAGLPLLEAKGTKRKILNLVEKLTYTFSTKVYPNSKGLFDIIIKEKFTNTNKLKVLGNGSSNGINTDYFHPKNISEEIKQELKSKYGILPEHFVFIFIGRIVKDKGINELAAAFQKISEHYPEAKLLIVGDFERELDPVTEETESILHNNPNIILTGFQKDVRPYLCISDALVFPSYREGFPNVVMQAGAMGLPCIVSDINGCNEIISQNDNGTIIPVKNANALYTAMEAYLKNRHAVEMMKNIAREMITSRFEQQVLWQSIREEYVDLLNKVNSENV